MEKNQDLNKNEQELRISVDPDFDCGQVAEALGRQLKEMPVLTGGDIDGLRSQADALFAAMKRAGCALWLGMVKTEERPELPKLLIRAEGTPAMMAVMLCEVMGGDPMLKKAVLMAVAMRAQIEGLRGGYADDDDNDGQTAAAE